MEIVKSEYTPEIAKQLEMLKDTRINKTVDVEEEESQIELTQSKECLSFDLFTKNLEQTGHLDNYDAFDYDLGLDGENYKSFKKAVWYYHNSLKQPTRAYKINNRTRIDNRVHLLGIAPASSGKTSVKNQIKRISNKNETIELTGVSHDQQLIGKVVHEGKGEDKISRPVYGIMHYKGVLNDEAQDMLNEKTEIYAKSQRIKRLAMDAYGQNEISKKLVGDDKDEVLSYYSPSSVFDFAHPKKLDSPFFDTGSFRRYSVFNISYDQTISLKDVTVFNLENVQTNKPDYIKILNEFYNSDRFDVTFNQETLNIISHYHKCLLVYLLKHKNQNAFRYGLLTRYSLRDTLSKFVFVLAIAKNEQQPSLQTTIAACCDGLLFVLKSIESINQLGDMGISSDVWGGLGENDAQALEYLFRKGAVSSDASSVSIKKFWTILGNLYGCKNTQSRAHFYRLKRDGFVDSRKVGQYESVVWLKFIPKDIRLDENGFNNMAYPQELLQSVGSDIDLLTLSKRVFVDDKTLETAQTDGSVGVMGCVLLYYIYMHQLQNSSSLSLYIGNLTKQPQTPTLPTLSILKESSTTINPHVQPVKPYESVPTLSTHPEPKSTRDVQYFKAVECESIKQSCTREEVETYIKTNPEHTTKQLIDHFGVGVLQYKIEGVFN